MSGITGILSMSKELTPQTTLQAMTDIIQHRGPDGEGHFLAPQVALGYRHFDVHGLTAEQAQTLQHLNSYEVTFDGRIYNLPELQAELCEHGYAFDCASDAALLAAAYDHWGVDCLNKLNADWAFVIYDTQTKTFFIARDRFGIKPLYYYADATCFIFASEIKSIHASGQVDKAPNEAYLQAYLENGPNEYDAPTAFKDIVRFPFGHYFHGTLDQLLSSPHFTRYWEQQVNVAREEFDPAKAQEYAQQYYDLLADAVRIRMRGKVKIGAALSGGLDSSSIVYLMHQELQTQDASEPLQTFSSVYKTPGTEHCDESEFINIVADQLGVISNQIEPKVEDIPVEHEKMIWAMESPPGNTLMSSWHSFKMINEKGFKISLEGQGADEQLAGYPNFVVSYLLSLKAGSFLNELKSFEVSVKYKLLAIVLFLSRMTGTSKIAESLIASQTKLKIFWNLNENLKYSLSTDLPSNYGLDIPLSSCHQVETAYPFVDIRLVEFLASVPSVYKMHKGWSKYLARLAFNKKLQDDINWRKDKMGWPIPEEQWFNGPLKKWFEDKIAMTYNHAKPSFSQKVKFLNYEVFHEVFRMAKGDK